MPLKMFLLLQFCILVQNILKKKNVATVIEVEILFVKDEHTLLKEYSARELQGGKGRCL